LSDVLAFDCGGSRTRAGLYDASGTLVSDAEGGPANPIESGIENAVAQMARLTETLNVPDDAIIATGVAGARNDETREAIWAALAKRFPSSRIVVSDDLTPVLLANHLGNGAVLITAGTGSCVLALDSVGSIIRKGGRGPLLGDDGSAYAIAADALKRSARAEDGAAPSTALTSKLPEAVGVKTIEDLIAWQRTATKSQIAALAQAVCSFAEEGDAIATTCLTDQATLLANTAQSARIAAELDSDVRVLFNGGMFEHSEMYVQLLTRSLQSVGFTQAPELAPVRGHAAVRDVAANHVNAETIVDRVSKLNNTAQVLPATELKSAGPALDSLDAAGIVHRMIQTNDDVDAAMENAAAAIVEAVQHAAATIAAGGRIIYAGAGTSGRLAVLDAAECRPTFGVEEGRVIALIAGGDRALVESVEEAEDSVDAGRADLDVLTPAVNENDFVIGITASGTTPYACAVVERAAEQDARTALLTCNADSPDTAPLMIRLATGPEALPGSTRLKAGTATKLALNIISTGAFAQAGHIYDGWMVGVRPINVKLRARAARIIQAITTLDEAASRSLLQDAGNRIPVAIIMNQFQLSRSDAETRLHAANDDLRSVLNA
jgi:N-acetylmuramic acid 6-phosphate etherase